MSKEVEYFRDYKGTKRKRVPSSAKKKKNQVQEQLEQAQLEQTKPQTEPQVEPEVQEPTKEPQ